MYSERQCDWKNRQQDARLKIYEKSSGNSQKNYPMYSEGGVASDSNEGYEAPIKYIFKNVKQFQKKLPNVQ